MKTRPKQFAARLPKALGKGTRNRKKLEKHLSAHRL
jgi:hypothetical protein